jgi:hypothetical protein
MKPSTSLLAFIVTAAAAFSLHAGPESLPSGVTRVPVTFSGGYNTEGVDHGRPVILIASALGVAPEVFREVFSHVHPAGPNSGGPSDAEARANKAVLINGLGKYGIDDARINEVSNYYRYNRSRGEMWKTKPAAANALVKAGAVVGFEITDAGSGYSSTPTISVPNVQTPSVKVEISYGKDFATNGSVSAITLAQGKGN